MDVSEIINQEYSEEFDKLRKNRVAVSYFKYGPAKANFGGHLVNANPPRYANESMSRRAIQNICLMLPTT